MEFVCPICEATGEIPEDDLTHSITRTSCRDCGTILLINPDTGKVDAYKSPFKDLSLIETSDSQSTDRSLPVFAIRHRIKSAKDWPAVVVVVTILLVLISSGVYFAVNLVKL